MGTSVSFGKWYDGASVYQSGSCFSLDTPLFKHMRCPVCPSLFLVGCWLIDAAVPCKEVVDSDDWMSTFILSTDIAEKLQALLTSITVLPMNIENWGNRCFNLPKPSFDKFSMS